MMLEYWQNLGPGMPFVLFIKYVISSIFKNTRPWAKTHIL